MRITPLRRKEIRSTGARKSGEVCKEFIKLGIREKQLHSPE
jgi:hypothetical protein